MDDGERMPEIAFVTYRGLPELWPGDRLAAAELARHGVRVVPAAWDDPSVDWPAFDAVVVRSTWDYWTRADEFAAWIEARALDGTALWNPASLLRWNLDKGYLREMEARGVPIVPTAWPADGETLAGVMAERGWTRAVVKPRCSGNGAGTWVVDGMPTPRQEDALARTIASAGAMVQPFVPQVVDPGEWSLVFFGGWFSHAVLKRPGTGEFRVQYEHGGSAELTIAPRRLVEAAERVLAQVEQPWLYARVDGCEVEGQFLLTELEMLEPSLFLDLHPVAPMRFASSIRALVGGGHAALTR
jgi:glutathione synthase/RimK-type ligase-like ATP-grasp enzyme